MVLQKKKKIIGTHQDIRLVGYVDSFVTAKIDTGADDSAIWASDIHEKDGTLSFRLFAPTSSFYTGKSIKTDSFDIVKVKNSFGETEYRYKVSLQIEVQNDLYEISLNLSDRKRSKFPILIGKRFLKNYFIVDVSKRDVSKSKLSDKKRIIILKSVIDDKAKSFINLLSKEVKSELILNNYKSLQFEINDHGIPKILLPDGSDLSSAKVVYFKSHNLYPEHASAVARYLTYKHVSFFDREINDFVSTSKLSEMFIFATSGVAVPRSLVISGRANIPEYESIKTKLGGVFVIKGADSNRGKNNFLVTDDISYNQAIDRIEKANAYIFQQYIENDGFLRILLIGGKVIQIVKRSSTEHKDPLRSHLNKPLNGANAIELNVEDCNRSVLNLAHKAAIAMGRSVVGVDLIQDKNTQKWYVLEANNNPEIIGGINIAKKIKGLANFLESEER